MSKNPMPLVDVQVGDAIWSGGMRWIVTRRMKTWFEAERMGYTRPIRETWDYGGAPCAALRPAEPETPAQLQAWLARRQAWLAQQAERDATRRAAREVSEACAIIRDAADDLVRHVRNPATEGDRLATARALADFVQQMVQEAAK